MTGSVRILLVSGSLRGASTNTATLRTAELVAPDDVVTSRYRGLASLPHFNPDDDVDPLPAAAADLRASIRAADAVLFSTPEYAGALPGSFKNLLDWTIGDAEPRSIYDKPVAWINTSPRGAVHAHESLRLVLSYAHAEIVEAACAHLPVMSADIDAAGVIDDREIRHGIATVLSTLAAHVTSPTVATG